MRWLRPSEGRESSGGLWLGAVTVPLRFRWVVQDFSLTCGDLVEQVQVPALVLAPVLGVLPCDRRRPVRAGGAERCPAVGGQDVVLPVALGEQTSLGKGHGRLGSQEADWVHG